MLIIWHKTSTIKKTKIGYLIYGFINGSDNTECVLSQRDTQYILTIHRFHIWKFTYLVKFICNSKIIAHTAVTFIHRHLHVRMCGRVWVIHAHIPGWDQTRQHFAFFTSAHTLASAFCDLFNVTCLASLCFLLIIILFKMSTKHSS